MAAEVRHGPQAQAGGEHALEQRAGEGLPVETAGEAVLPRVAVEEAARPQHERQCRGRGGTRDPEPALEPGIDRLEPAPPARRASQGEEHDVLREHRELQVELLGAERERQVRGERTGPYGGRHAGDLTAAQPTPDGRRRLGPEHPKERVAEREGEQRLEEPRGAGSEVPDLLARERPERLAPAVVLAV